MSAVPSPGDVLRADQGSQGAPGLPALINDVTAVLASLDAQHPQAMFDALAAAHEQLVTALAESKAVEQRRASLRLLFDMGLHGHAAGSREDWVADRLAAEYQGRHRDDALDGRYRADYRDMTEAVHGTYYYGAHRPV